VLRWQRGNSALRRAASRAGGCPSACSRQRVARARFTRPSITSPGLLPAATCSAHALALWSAAPRTRCSSTICRRVLDYHQHRACRPGGERGDRLSRRRGTFFVVRDATMLRASSDLSGPAVARACLSRMRILRGVLGTSAGRAPVSRSADGVPACWPQGGSRSFTVRSGRRSATGLYRRRVRAAHVACAVGAATGLGPERLRRGSTQVGRCRVRRRSCELPRGVAARSSRPLVAADPLARGVSKRTDVDRVARPTWARGGRSPCRRRDRRRRRASDRERDADAALRSASSTRRVPPAVQTAHRACSATAAPICQKPLRAVGAGAVGGRRRLGRTAIVQSPRARRCLSGGDERSAASPG